MDAGDRAAVSLKVVADCLALRRSGLGQLEAKREIAKNFMDVLHPTSSSSARQATWRKKNQPLLTYLCSLVQKIPTVLFDKMSSSKLANVILPMAALQSCVDQDSASPLDCEPLLDFLNLYKLALTLIKSGQNVARTLVGKSKLMLHSNINTTPANKAEGSCVVFVDMVIWSLLYLR